MDLDWGTGLAVFLMIGGLVVIARKIGSAMKSDAAKNAALTILEKLLK